MGQLTLSKSKSQQKRDLLHLSPDCNDNVILPSETDAIALTISLVGLWGLTLELQDEISKTINSLSRNCNDISQALDGLSQELREVGEGLLGNWATTDSPPLATPFGG